MFIRLVFAVTVGLATSGWVVSAARAEGSLALKVEAESAASADPHRAGQGSASAGHSQPNQSPLEFKKDLAIWTGIIFLLLLAILWKFAWGPIIQGLDKREQGIAEQIAQAEEANRQSKLLLGQYEQKLNDSKDEVRSIIAQAREDAAQTAREIVDKSKEEAMAERRRALQEIDAATGQALKELADRSATLAVELAGKIVRHELKTADHAKLIQQAVANFAQAKPGAN